MLECYCGRFDRAEAQLAEVRDVLAATGSEYVMGTTLTEMALLAHRGREAQARAAAASLGQISMARGQGLVASFAQAQLCILDLSLGHYQQAPAAAQEVFAADPPDLGIKMLPDLVEAACRAGEEGVAAAGLARLQARARASGTPWALGPLARAQALLVGEELYREALAQLIRGEAAVDLARAHLLYGEQAQRGSVVTCDELTPQRTGSPGWRPRAPPTPRSLRSCSSARAQSTITCGRCSGNWTSATAPSSPAASRRLGSASGRRLW